MGFTVRVADAELTPDGPRPNEVLAGNPVTSDDNGTAHSWAVLAQPASACVPAAATLIIYPPG
ncbi:MAG: hypothetical protein J2P17_34720 [Mycobacterium sp.]|nr:hypothetical protein [Mycobacterium sp.]